MVDTLEEIRKFIVANKKNMDPEIQVLFKSIPVWCAMDYPYSVGPYAQICAEVNLPKNDRNFYEAHFDKLKDNFDLSGNVLEACAGILPVFSDLIAQHQIKIGTGTITAYDPRLFNIPAKYPNLKLCKEKVTEDTDISRFDLITALFPCEGSEDILRLACENQKDFYIALCGCWHKNPDDEPLEERMIRTAKDLVKKYNLGNLVVDYIDEKYKNNYAILYNKRK